MFEDKQRLWLDELEDLKQMYMARLQQVTQQAQRGQRALQLQLYKAQQEKKRLQEELNMQQCQCEEAKLRQSQGERVSPKLEETKWEVSPLPSLPPGYAATMGAVVLCSGVARGHGMGEKSQARCLCSPRDAVAIKTGCWLLADCLPVPCRCVRRQPKSPC